MEEVQQNQGRRGKFVFWSYALGTLLLAVSYAYLFIVINTPIPGSLTPLGESVGSLGSWHWLSISFVLTAVFHYFWFKRVASVLSRYRPRLALIGLHVLGAAGGRTFHGLRCCYAATI
jgi:hypothetical protein